MPTTVADPIVKMLKIYRYFGIKWKNLVVMKLEGAEQL
jgi:hypothetical protein